MLHSTTDGKGAVTQKVTAPLVPVVGLEPTPCRQERILSPSRLPFHHTGDSTPNIILDTEEEFKRKYWRKTEK